MGNTAPEEYGVVLQEFWVLPYEDVIEIDEHGDDWFEGPHIYVPEFSPGSRTGPFRQYVHVKLETIGQWDRRSADANPDKRVKKFHREPHLLD